MVREVRLRSKNRLTVTVRHHRRLQWLRVKRLTDSSASERTAVRRCGAEQQQHSLESWLQQCGVPEEGDLRLFWGQRADSGQVRLLLSLSMTPWSSEEVRFVIDGAGGWHVELYGCLHKWSSDSLFAARWFVFSSELFATFRAIHCRILVFIFLCMHN